MYPFFTIPLVNSASVTSILTDRKRSPPYISDGLVVSFVIGSVALTSLERNSLVFDGASSGNVIFLS